MENVIKGYEYEVFIRNHIDKLDNVSDVWLWKNVPEQELFNAGLIIDYNNNRKNRLKSKNTNENIAQDIGLDIIQRNNNNEYIYVQCKNYSRTLHTRHLAGFFMRMSSHPDKKGDVYHSIDKISRNLRKYSSNRISFIHVPHVEEIKPNTEIVPYKYQSKIIKQIIKYFSEHDKGILTMPCGTGKTLISCFVAKYYDQVIFISPLKQFAQQNKIRYREYDTRKGLLVDSEGTRDIQEIKEFIRKNDKFLLSATYRSCDIIVDILQYLEDPLIIIDEFHNLSHNNIYGKENNPIYKLINSDNKILYMSATPRIYELEGDNDCDVEDVLGKMIYKMDFTHAIKKKYISNYDIILPILDDTDVLIDDIKSELNTKFNSMSLCKKCCYLYECIKRYGKLKCIIYFQSHKHIDRFIRYFDKINKYYGYDYYMDKIICDTGKRDRTDILDKFRTYDGIALLCSVRILDECIDIPECNSIYVTYSCKSKIKNIQRMCRAMRIDKNHKNKKAKIILWCREFDKMLTYMSSIKEFDLDFHTKIKYVRCSNKLYRQKEVDVESKKYNEKYKKYVVGIQEYRIIKWNEWRDLLFEYCNINKQMPIKKTKYKNQNIGQWLHNQKKKVKCNTDYVYVKLSKNEYVKQSLDEYLEYKEINKNKIKLLWNEWKELLFEYCDTHKKIPSIKLKYKQQNIGCWIRNQKNKIKNNTNELYIKLSKNKYVKQSLDKYLEYKEINQNKIKLQWNEWKNLLFEYCNVHKKMPIQKTRYKQQNIGKWLQYQKIKIENNSTDRYIQLSQNEYVKESIDKY